MNARQVEQFQKWATDHSLDAKDWAELSFAPDLHLNRFWEVPPKQKRRAEFLLCMLDLMGRWETCFVWRNMGRWPCAPDYRDINSRIEYQILTGIGLPMGTSDIVEFSRLDTDRLVTLLFASTIFGFCVDHDTFLVPNNAQFILKTSHHNVVEMAFRTEQAMTQFVAGMQTKGFILPDHLPDATFMQPEWMENDQQYEPVGGNNVTTRRVWPRMLAKFLGKKQG